MLNSSQKWPASVNTCSRDTNKKWKDKQTQNKRSTWLQKIDWIILKSFCIDNTKLFDRNEMMKQVFWKQMIKQKTDDSYIEESNETINVTCEAIDLPRNIRNLTVYN